MSMVYIKKVLKDGMKDIGFLSPLKKRWLPINGKHRLGKFDEIEAKEYCEKKEKEGDWHYYYFRVIM